MSSLDTHTHTLVDAVLQTLLSAAVHISDDEDGAITLLLLFPFTHACTRLQLLSVPCNYEHFEILSLTYI